MRLPRRLHPLDMCGGNEFLRTARERREQRISPGHIQFTENVVEKKNRRSPESNLEQPRSTKFQREHQRPALSLGGNMGRAPI